MVLGLCGVGQPVWGVEAPPPGGMYPWAYPMSYPNPYALPPQQTAATVAEPMQIQGSTAQANVFLGQALIYTVQISSPTQLMPNFEPSLLPSADWRGRPLRDGARHRSVMTPQGQRWYYEFSFALIPQSVGQLNLPVAQATVQPLTAPGAIPATPILLEMKDPTQLAVKPKPTAARDGLPAEGIHLRAWFQPQVSRAEVGQALTLWVQVAGQGISSDQLPSLANQLQRPGYELHLQDAQRQHWADAEGHLYAELIERYQLIPRNAGLLSLPALQVHWFDLTAHKARDTATPAALLSLEITESIASAQARNQIPRMQDGSAPVLLPPWVLFSGGVLLLLAGWWIFWFSHHPAPFRWLRRAPAARPPMRFVPAAHNPFQPQQTVRVAIPSAPRPASTVRFVPAAHNPFVAPEAVAKPAVVSPRASVSYPSAAPIPAPAAPLPRPVQGGVRGWWRRLRLPAFPLWECLRCIKTVDEPSTLCHLLQRFACKQFGTPLSTPLKQISQQIGAAYPTLDQGRLQQLLNELDDATYGRSAIDLRRWKRAFRRLMWPTFFLRPKATTPPQRRRAHRGHLPELNPRA